VYHETCTQKYQNWQLLNVWIGTLCGHMPSSTMVVSQYRLLLISHIALYVHQLFIILLVDGCLPRYWFTDILSHAASYSCCSQSYGSDLNMHPGSYFEWLHWQGGVGLTGVCVATVYQWVVHGMKRLSVSSIRIRLHLGQVFVEPWYAVVAKEMKMIMKRGGKSWGIYS